MNKDIENYNQSQTGEDKIICERLAALISNSLNNEESKLWHGAPVWFIDGNPVAGYDKLKDSVRLLFWSGQSFNEPGLQNEGTFKAAEMRYTSADQINEDDINRWLQKSKTIQWDYKNIVKNRGKLNRIK